MSPQNILRRYLNNIREIIYAHWCSNFVLSKMSLPRAVMHVVLCVGLRKEVSREPFNIVATLYDPKISVSFTHRAKL